MLMGHFLQTDPVGYKSDLDLYEYVGDDPEDRADPTGQSPLEAVFVVVDAVSLAADLHKGASLGQLAGDAGNLALDVVGTASPVPGISEAGHAFEAVTKGAEVVHAATEAEHAAAETAVHGNSAASTKVQHAYVMKDSSGRELKHSISGQPLNKNGTSPRANRQIKGLESEFGPGVTATVGKPGIQGRSAALTAEREAVRDARSRGEALPAQKRPQ